MGCHLIQECPVGDSVKSLAEVQIDNIHSLSCIHQVGHLVIKRDQVDQTQLTPPKPVLAWSDTLAILCMLCDGTQDDLFQNLVRILVLWILLPGLVDKHCPGSSHPGPSWLASTAGK
ncbi:hypothetical protein DUI87_05915 [Hirundo rustica rustica]|uniref:Uncharacterized protein n=1 Tax=Hirundo rustica rustica TaxID=333673 RepID=A0A3M0L0P1_HIRRU|nr:hypothetical protein DUI87_05915 [Hirundo rustica rustica]